MNTEKIDFGAEISKLMPLLIREMTRKKDTIFSSGELTVAHIAIIEYLSEKGISNMTDIAMMLSLSMSSSTSIIDKMIEMKSVKRARSEKDRRVVLVMLDEKGIDTAGRIMKERKNVFNDLFSPLEDSEKSEYLRLLKKIHDNLRDRYEKK